MKKLSLTILCALLLFGAMAQQSENRTVNTIIADVLAQMPTNNQENYNRQMKDLVSTGEAGVLMLVRKINPPGKGSNAPADYALSGLAHYVSEAGQETARQTTVNALKKALTSITEPEITAFLTEQLRVMGEGAPVVFPPQPLPENVTKNAPAYLRIAALQLDMAKLVDPENKYDLLHVPVAKIPIPVSLEKKKEQELAKLVTDALKDPSVEYRNAALDFASPCAGKELYAVLFKALPKLKPDVKTDVLNWIGREAQCPEKCKMLANVETGIETTAVQSIVKELNGKDFEVKKAAAWALVGLGRPEAVPFLGKLLASDDRPTIELGKQALASFKGDIFPPSLLTQKTSEAGQIAVLELLSLRKATSLLNVALNLTKSASPDVRAAAYNTLKDVVGEKDQTNLCGMLETAENQYIVPLQQAVTASFASLPPAQRMELLVRRMYQADENKKHLYYLPLSATGERKALEFITDEFTKGKGEAKEAAFNALLTWKDFEVAEDLYTIIKDPSANEYFERAFNAYVKKVSNPALTGENRLIFLRKAMEIAKTDAQKNVILKQIGQTGTFLALLYAGQFVDQPALKENAAQAVMNIALNHKEYTGENVVTLLSKAAAALNNPDADYQRQSVKKHLEEMPKEKGFVSIFNGIDLTGWKGLVENPVKRARMKPAELEKAQTKADEQMRRDWKVENGMLVFDGTGYDNICTEKQYGDFEMYVDWQLAPSPEADAGIYLRGTPQVQIWNIARTNVGAEVGSGGLYNNRINPSKPLKVADNALGEWNTFHIRMIGDRVTVVFNGELVVDNVILENYWDHSLPIFPIEQIELQAHGTKVYYRNLYVKELERFKPFELSEQEKKEGFTVLFDGTNMHEWVGNLTDYQLKDGCISVNPTGNRGGNLYTKKEYANFVYRFEFQLTPAANNGVGIRAPMEGDNAYNAMEIQILDCEHPVYKDIAPYQHHASVYGVIPAEHGAMKPVGEWNSEEIYADGDHIRVTLNGKVILDGNIREAAKNGTVDHREHPGLFNKSGHIGFLGHGDKLKFRNIRVKELKN